MATTIDTSSAAAAATAASAKSSAVAAKDESSGADRFLKLLVAQMKNQDPLNPMDNAEVTSQMAQISTVSGIEKLNRSVESMNGSFAQMQNMQIAALVGRDVMLAGNRMTLDEAGNGRGGFDLDTPADSVRVDILSAAGAVLDTFDLGAQGAGRHSFDWKPKPGVRLEAVDSFRVTARAGAASVASTALMRDRVDAVLTGGTQLTLELQSSGNVPYAQIKAIN